MINMKQNYLELIKSLESINISESPNFKVMQKMHEELRIRGLTFEEATKIVARMDVQVNSEFVEDEQLFNTVASYAELTLKVKKTFDNIIPGLFWENVENNLQNKITIHYN